MRLVIQKVSQSNVKVDGKIVGEIGKGYMVLVGITEGDDEKIVDKMVDKLVNLRIFEDTENKMNLSLIDIGGSILSISQFTLYANCKDGNRPSFIDAAKPDIAEDLYKYFCEKCKEYQIDVETGIFGADMQVKLINDGPVTIIIEKNRD